MPLPSAPLASPNESTSSTFGFTAHAGNEPALCFDEVANLTAARLRSSQAKAQVLLVEDDEKLAYSIRSGLELEGHAVMLSRTAEEAFDLISKGSFDVVVLDIMLPGKSGLQLLMVMRSKRIGTPLIIISARDTTGDRILGLESGADDYLVKPFALAELMARIRAQLRRGHRSVSVPLECADLAIDVRTRSAKRSGTPVPLTFREFEILEYLCQNQGHIVTRAMLARDIWKETNRYTPLDNVINVHMARLRRKVDDPYDAKLIHTVRSLGFILGERSA